MNDLYPVARQPLALSLLTAVILVAVGLPPIAAADLRLLTPDPALDDLAVWEVSDPLPAWLSFDTVQLPRVVFTAPNGRSWTRACYLDQAFTANPDRAEAASEWLAAGDRGLRVRHTLRVPGLHKWVLRDAAGQELAHGEVTAAPARDHVYPPGPLTISRDNPRLLAFADGTIFIPIGPNIAWANPPDRLERFARCFAALRAAGGTHCRVWFAGWCAGLESPQADAYRLDHAWVMDRILALAREHHLRVTLVLDNHHDIKHGETFPYGVDYAARLKHFMQTPPPLQYERRLRYVLARWGADDTVAGWELFNELDLAQGDRPAAVAWVTGAAALLASLDDDHRLRSCSWSADDWDQLTPVPQLDLVQIHSYVLEWNDPIGLLKMGHRDGVGMLIHNAERANGLAHPFCFSELGYQGTNDQNPGNDLDVDGMLLRQQLWAGFLLGGYGTGMNWWWDTYLEPRGLWKAYAGFARIVPHLDWRDRALAPLTPNPASNLRITGWQSARQALLWTQLRSDTWYHHLVEGKPRPRLRRPVGFRLAGMQPNQAFRVHQFDMITGDEVGSVEVTSNQRGDLDLAAPPPGQDVVLWVEWR